MTAADLLRLDPDDEGAFDRLAREVFERQQLTSPTYRSFSSGFGWHGWRQAPFLPVEAFKRSGICSIDEHEADAVFLSSATGGTRSRHPIKDIGILDELAIGWFGRCFGQGPFRFLVHLPTYETLGNASSLIHMVRTLVSAFGTADSAFVLEPERFRQLLSDLPRHRRAGQRHGTTIVFGTAFGLLDLVEDSPVEAPQGTIVIETGGMKFRRREVDRQTLHEHLADGFGLPRSAIRSEYGMCELVSQFYTAGANFFLAPPWAKTLVLDPDNPTVPVERGEVGLLGIFDLGNVHSVSAILTSDLARIRPDGVEILGRVAAAELRGCNFLLEANP